MKTKIVAIVGPTASGKTSLSIELAKQIDGEIISCDSMQVYRHMNIGTAKPTAEEMAGVVHHLIDIVDPDEEFSCADYAVLAKEKIKEVVSRGKVPIFCGGTGLYIDNVVNNTVFSKSGRDDKYREILNRELQERGVDYLHNKLSLVDPVAAENIHPNNVKRVIRALEIYHTTGKTKTEWDADSKRTESPYDACIICLDYKNRETLYNRIDKRVDIMLESGLVEEVTSLVKERRIKLSDTAVQGIGYKEIIEYLNGGCEFKTAVDKIKQGTRNYAKRQLTWFRRNKNARFIFVDEYDNFDDVVKIAKNMILS